MAQTSRPYHLKAMFQHFRKWKNRSLKEHIEIRSLVQSHQWQIQNILLLQQRQSVAQ